MNTTYLCQCNILLTIQQKGAMRSARAQFKYALRQCKLDERLILK